MPTVGIRPPRVLDCRSTRATGWALGRPCARARACWRSKLVMPHPPTAAHQRFRSMRAAMVRRTDLWMATPAIPLPATARVASTGTATQEGQTAVMTRPGSGTVAGWQTARPTVKPARMPPPRDRTALRAATVVPARVLAATAPTLASATVMAARSLAAVRVMATRAPAVTAPTLATTRAMAAWAAAPPTLASARVMAAPAATPTAQGMARPRAPAGLTAQAEYRAGMVVRTRPHPVQGTGPAGRWLTVGRTGRPRDPSAVGVPVEALRIQMPGLGRVC